MITLSSEKEIPSLLSRSINLLVSGGYFMTVGDKSPFWEIPTLAAREGVNLSSARNRECVEDWWGAPPRTKLTIGDILSTDVDVVYSYSMASRQDLLHDHAREIPPTFRKRLLVVLAGVPDAWMSQFYGDIWHVHGFHDRAIFINVNATPKSAGVVNSGYRNLSWDDSLPTLNLSDPSTRWLNVDASSLFPALSSPIFRHTSLCNDSRVIERVISYLKGVSS